MDKITTLAKRFEQHISLPWQRHLTGAEKTIFIVYPKEDERRLRAKRRLFAQAAERAGHPLVEKSLDQSYASWMRGQEYADEYYATPQDLRQKLEKEFPIAIADDLRQSLIQAGPQAVLAVYGVGTLFGFTQVTSILRHLGGDIPGRLAIFFPGSHDQNTYRLLDARDGWGYLAVPITLHDVAHL